MKLYYYSDPAVRAACYARGADYTPAYLPVMLKNWGLTGEAIEPSGLSALRADDMLLIGADTLDTAAQRLLMDRDVAVIGFGSRADALFGVSMTGEVDTGDIYAPVACFHFTDSEVPLPVLQGYLQAESVGETLGTIDGAPACVACGKTVWFAFDLPATLWRTADGRPTDEITLFTFGRIPDGEVMPDDYDRSIAYADVYRDFCLRRLAAFPRVMPLPAKDGHAARLLLCFAGDDDSTDARIDMVASERMYERGLPYHINLMPAPGGESFIIDREQMELVLSRGHELALHYDFIAYPYTEEGWRAQIDLYNKLVPTPNIGPVNHCLAQIGSAANRFRVELEQGALGDNSRFQAEKDPDDINAFNLCGFACGSAFPRFAIDDAAHGNRELAFCEMPVSYYEPRIYEGKEAACRSKICAYLDESLHLGRTSQFFIHPHYISGIITPAEPALKALDVIQQWLAEHDENIVLCGPDAVIRWWHDRAACRIYAVDAGGFFLDNPSGRAVTVALPAAIDTVTVNGVPVTTERMTVGNDTLTLLTVCGASLRVSY